MTGLGVVIVCNMVLEGSRAIVECLWAETYINKMRAVARALIGGLNIHIFVLCPTNFF